MFDFFKKPKQEILNQEPPAPNSFSNLPIKGKKFDFNETIKNTFQIDVTKTPPVAVDVAGTAMDSGLSSMQAAKISASGSFGNIPDAQISWYAGQGFIGYQLCAMLAQNWLIDKACTMPARDAVRKGYEITVNDGTKVDPETLEKLKKCDSLYDINSHLINFVKFGRVFGIRVALFKVDGIDYEKPFNPDGVKKGSYKGVVQIDPYWITPELDMEGASNPANSGFYEPTWWRVNAQRIHKSHLVIYRTSEVPDILKPTYIYGGIPIPQKIAERVYAADRTANEAPLLAMTKRTTTLKTDVEQALANEGDFTARLEQWVQYRDNFGVKVVGLNDEIGQMDTSLADLDEVIMTQYQLVAAAANVPATKLLGTTPKGFNSTGEYEEASYHEELESIQSEALTKFLDRHHLLCIRSEVSPKNPFQTAINWNPLDAMTAEEQAALNKIKAETGAILSGVGAIDGQAERDRIISDPKSGYNGISDEEVIEDPLEEGEEFTEPETLTKEGDFNDK